MSLAVITGLAAEARIAVAPSGAMLVGAGRSDRLAADLETAIARGARRLLSFGVAGALAPHLQAGDLIVAHGVLDGARRHSCDVAWREAMSGRLRRASERHPHPHAPHSVHDRSAGSGLFRFAGAAGWQPISHSAGRPSPAAEIAAVDAPLADAVGKTALFAATGAAAVDMESAIVARAALRHDLPFAILRVIADPAHRPLPSAALVAMGADGEVDIGAVLGALLRNPRQLPALIRLARDSRDAFAALGRARAVLGEDFGSLGLAQAAPDADVAQDWSAVTVAG